MKTPLELSLELASEVKSFPLGECGPSDDTDMQYAYAAQFRDLAVRFVAAVKRVGDPDLSEQLPNPNITAHLISDAHELRAELLVVCDALAESAADPDFATCGAARGAFLCPDLIEQLRALPQVPLDPKKLIRMCEELNEAYARANYISTALLVRAIMNHIPPVFGQENFEQVVSQVGRTLKGMFERLQNEARPVADIHTHQVMRKTEHLPTKNQLEPSKPGFELLLQEVVTRLQGESPLV
ncbi:MAG: hypothetical protein SFV15_16635 [Polyangiaceae bacterium]|nr:hypothetical protein [Polyangiaceae bacterium]